MMKQIIFALSFLLSHLVYGSMKTDDTNSSQKIQYYQEIAFQTPEEWKKIPCLNDPRITTAEEKIAEEQALRRCCQVGTWRLTNQKTTLLNDSVWHSGCKTPCELNLCNIYLYTKSELETQSQELMEKAQHCLRRSHIHIANNVDRQKWFIDNNDNNNNKQYLGSVPKEELQRRIILFEQIYDKHSREDYTSSEDETFDCKRQRTTL